MAGAAIGSGLEPAVEEMIRYLTSRAPALSVFGTLRFAIRAESLSITSDSHFAGR